MKKSALFGLFVIIIVATLISGCTESEYSDHSSSKTEETKAQFKLLEHHGEIRSTGTYYVTGMVQNVGNKMGNLDLEAKFYDANGVYIDHGTTFPGLIDVGPGEKATFEIIGPLEKGSSVARYTIAEDVFIGDPKLIN